LSLILISGVLCLSVAVEIQSCCSVIVCITLCRWSDSGGIKDNDGKWGQQASMFAIATEMVAEAAVVMEYCSGMVLEGE